MLYLTSVTAKIKGIILILSSFESRTGLTFYSVGYFVIVDGAPGARALSQYAPLSILPLVQLNSANNSIYFRLFQNLLLFFRRKYDIFLSTNSNTVFLKSLEFSSTYF